MRMAVEDSVDLPVTVAILFEDVPQEHQFGRQAVFITEISDSMHQNRQYSFFVGWVIMALVVGVEIGVWTCGTLCVIEGDQVSCKYLSPRSFMSACL
jgi:hypothetical protein